MTEQKDLNQPIVWDDLTPREVPVKLAGQDYVLVEATAEDAKAWRANNMQSIRMQETGKGKNKKSTSAFDSRIADSHILLVSLCLKKIEGGVRVRVSQDTIRAWRNPVVEDLFKRAEAISDLAEDEDGEEENPEKNSSGVKSPDISADTP